MGESAPRATSHYNVHILASQVLAGLCCLGLLAAGSTLDCGIFEESFQHLPTCSQSAKIEACADRIQVQSLQHQFSPRLFLGDRCHRLCVANVVSWVSAQTVFAVIRMLILYILTVDCQTNSIVKHAPCMTQAAHWCLAPCRRLYIKSVLVMVSPTDLLHLNAQAWRTHATHRPVLGWSHMADRPGLRAAVRGCADCCPRHQRRAAASLTPRCPSGGAY